MKEKALIGILLIAVLLAGCIQEPEEEQKVVKIGAVLPLTGKYASYGERTRNGIELALEEVNSNGKVLEVIYEDSEGKSDTAVSAARKLIEIDQVEVVFTQLSSISMALAPIAEEKKIVLFGFTLTPDYTMQGEYIFRNRGDAIEEGKAIGQFVLDNGLEKVAVLYHNNDTHKGEVDGLKQVIEGETEVVFEEGYDKEEKDFRTILLKIKETEPDLVLAASRDKELALILKQARELGIETQFFSTQGIDSQAFLEEAGEVAEGLIYARAILYEDSAKGEVQKAFSKFREKFGTGMDLYAGDAYDVVMALGKVAIDGATNSEEIKEALLKIEGYLGVSGTISFNEFGDVPKEFKLFTVKNGSYVPYEAS